MSWYKEIIRDFIGKGPFDLEASTMPCAKLYDQIEKKLPVTITVTDMYDERDKAKLTSALLNLEGVLSVKPILPQKKLVVVYNPDRIDVQDITQIIARLGYHYVLHG